MCGRVGGESLTCGSVGWGQLTGNRRYGGLMVGKVTLSVKGLKYKTIARQVTGSQVVGNLEAGTQ